VLSRSAERGQAFASEHGGVAFTDLSELLAARPDVLVVALPNSQHVPVARAAFAAGVDVLLEKPMATTAAASSELSALATSTGRVLMVGHMWRYDPQARWLRDQVASGELGEIVKTKGYGIHVDWGPSGWFTDPELAGGGALIDMGVHAIDTARFLLGDPQPKSVFAQLGVRYSEGPLDDHGILVITWEGGTTSLIESGWWNPHMDGAEASTQLFGTAGYGRLFPTGSVVGRGDGRVSNTPDFPFRSEHCDQSIYDAQMVAFLEDCRLRRVPEASAAAGEVVMRICEAAYESSRTGQVVSS
jgi:predicted dehydrogenase